MTVDAGSAVGGKFVCKMFIRDCDYFLGQAVLGNGVFQVTAIRHKSASKSK